MLVKDYLPGWLRKPLAQSIEWIEDFAAPRFSSIVTAQVALAQRFTALNPRTICVANFALLEEFPACGECTWSARPHAIAYVGGISLQRGLREMVEAVSLLPEALHPKLKLAGEFFPDNLRNELGRMKGVERVEVLGFLDRTGVVNVLRQARVGLSILHSTPNHLISWPTKVFEYMCAGIPVIVSDFLLWTEIVKGARCGLAVDPLDTKQIAQAMEYLLTHPEEAEAMGRRGREAVEKKYNWATEGKKLLALYEEVLANA
jgi:glycosyltransferase involved in cell wall biosynthesis